MAGIRVAKGNDAAAVAAIYAPYVLETAISFEEAAPSDEEMRSRIEKTLLSHPYLVFENDDGVVAGYAHASPHKERASYRWSVDVTVYTAQAFHRRGVGRALYEGLLDILARQGFHRAFAGISLPNEKSVGFHEAMGFRYIGAYDEVGFKLGAWRNVGWWSRPIGPGGPPAAEPIAFPALDQSALT